MYKDVIEVMESYNPFDIVRVDAFEPLCFVNLPDVRFTLRPYHPDLEVMFKSTYHGKLFYDDVALADVIHKEHLLLVDKAVLAEHLRAQIRKDLNDQGIFDVRVGDIEVVMDDSKINAHRWDSILQGFLAGSVESVGIGRGLSLMRRLEADTPDLWPHFKIFADGEQLFGHVGHLMTYHTLERDWFSDELYELGKYINLVFRKQGLPFSGVELLHKDMKAEIFG